MADKLSCFKAYDIRGRVPGELNAEVAYRIAQAYTAHIRPSVVVVGHDMRLSSPAIAHALHRGFLDGGVDVIDIGLVGTEEVYFATFFLGVDGGIMVTASHNPADYNGMKLVREGAQPISGDSGLDRIEELCRRGKPMGSAHPGRLSKMDNKPAYIDHLLSYVDRSRLKPLKIVANAGNGCAGPVVDLLERHLPFQFIKVYWRPDGSFPHGVPNPLLPENRSVTSEMVRDNRADFGIAWDGDFDRCFLFDENGDFVEGYYMVGLLAKAILADNPGEKIIHDPRLIWNTQKIVTEAGGIPVMCKTGHAFIKERMLKENAIYGGEMSAHHYFRDFAFCDSGMIPWLLAAKILSESGKPLSRLVQEMREEFPISGEINRRVADPDAVIRKVESFYNQVPGEKDFTDGLSFATETFRFNIRKSNTEPVLRLNVETRGDKKLLEEKMAELLRLIEG